MVEMEVAALFIIGIMRGIRTAAIATADGNVFNEGDYDPHGKIVAEGKIKMLKCGLNVAKQAALEDMQKDQLQIFDSQTQLKYLDTFRSKSLFDFLQNIQDLDDKKRSVIMQLARMGSFPKFKFFLEKATHLDENEIIQAIILFQKVQKGADPEFFNKSVEFI